MAEKIIKTGNEGGVHKLIGNFVEHEDSTIETISGCNVIHESTDPHKELSLPSNERIVIGESVEFDIFGNLTKEVID